MFSIVRFLRTGTVASPGRLLAEAMVLLFPRGSEWIHNGRETDTVVSRGR
jgi:hypothetical protein